MRADVAGGRATARPGIPGRRDQLLERLGHLLARESHRPPGSAPSARPTSRRRRPSACRGTRRPAAASRRGSAPTGRGRRRRRRACRRPCAPGRPTPWKSPSLPIGISTATHLSLSRSRSCSSATKKSARSRSSRLISTSREISSSSQGATAARCRLDPSTPDTVTNRPSTTRSADSTSAWKLGSPGVSIRLMVRPSHSRWVTAAEMLDAALALLLVVICDRGLVSHAASRLMVPDSYRRASTSEVLPVSAVADHRDIADLSGSL